MNVIFWLIFICWCPQCFCFRAVWSGARFKSMSKLHAETKKAPSLLPTPTADSVANFLEYSSKEHQNKFIQCNIIAVGEIEGQKYGVGYPVNMPVMLTYFDNNDLKPVLPAHPDYEHLLDHVSLQLDESDLHLYKTPVVMTLEGEFDDDEFNQVDPFQLYQTLQSNKRRNRFTGQKLPSSAPPQDNLVGQKELEAEDEVEEAEEEAEEVSLEELMQSENISGLEEAYDASDFEEEDDLPDEPETNEKMDYHEADGREEWDDAFINEEENVMTRIEPVSTSELSYLPGAPKEPNTSFSYRTSAPASAGDITSIDRPPPVFPEITEVDLVTEEDTKSLNRAHRRADKIMEYAEDVKLMGSFHFKKKNYHLVRLLEPIFLIGKLIKNENGGDSYLLLDQHEIEKVRPVLEGLLLERSKDEQGSQTARNSDTRRPSGSALVGGGGDGGGSLERTTGSTGPVRDGYNKWRSSDSDRHRTGGNKHFAQEVGGRGKGNDRRRTTGSGSVGATTSTDQRHQSLGKLNGNRMNNNGRDMTPSHQDSVDEDQYERAREKWQKIKTNTDRRR